MPLRRPDRVHQLPDRSLASLAYDGSSPTGAWAARHGARSRQPGPRGPDATDEGRTYVFQLRPGVRFSNGAAVRPEDFRHSLERLLRLRRRSSLSLLHRDPRRRRCGRRRAATSPRGSRPTRGGRSRSICGARAEFLHALALPTASVVPADSPMRFAASPAPGHRAYRIVRFDPRRGGAPGPQPSLPPLVRGGAAGRLRRRDRHRRRDKEPARWWRSARPGGPHEGGGAVTAGH